MYQQPYNNEMDSLVSIFRSKMYPPLLKYSKAPKLDSEFLPKFDALNRLQAECLTQNIHNPERQFSKFEIDALQNKIDVMRD